MIQTASCSLSLQVALIDPDDNKFVDCAVAADAEFIVTNDKHFSILKNIPWPKLSVIEIKEFLAQIS